MNTRQEQELQIEPNPGQQLRLAREALGFTQKDVADHLCLKQSTVRDIEENENPLGLAPTFIRGYLRAYAKFVGLSDDEFFTSNNLQLENKSHEFSTFSLKGLPLNESRKRKKRDLWLMCVTWLILLMVLGLTGAWWWQKYNLQREEMVNYNTDAAQQLAQKKMIEQVVPSDESMNLEKDSLIDNSFSLPNEMQRQANLFPDQNATLTAQALAQQEIITNILAMTFIADCWVDIRDSTSQRLASGIIAAGEKLELAGKPPYFVKVGKPDAVQITFKEKTVNLDQLNRERSGFLVIPE